MGRRQWLWVALIIGAVYAVAGVVSAALAKSAGSSQGVAAWRLAAWAISAVVFAAHIGYEHFRLRSSARTTALHVALAVALGAFGLAVGATVHGYQTHHRFPPFALVAWPVMTALPAFVVAMVVAALLARMRHD